MGQWAWWRTICRRPSREKSSQEGAQCRARVPARTQHAVHGRPHQKRESHGDPLNGLVSTDRSLHIAAEIGDTEFVRKVMSAFGSLGMGSSGRGGNWMRKRKCERQSKTPQRGEVTRRQDKDPAFCCISLSSTVALALVASCQTDSRRAPLRSRNGQLIDSGDCEVDVRDHEGRTAVRR